MSVVEAIKKILGITPVKVSDLNREATQTRSGYTPVVVTRQPIDEIEVTEEFKKVRSLLDGGFPIVFVTGKAGTGKSTLIGHLRKTYKPNVVVVAPTGVAALNIKGATVHSFFGLPPRVINDEDILRVADRRLYTKIDLLVIDEVSMVRADLLDGVDKFLRLNGRDPEKPFGGTQMLLVGDLFQLPPVVTREEEAILFSRRYASPYFFSARSLQGCQIAPVELTRVFRQHDGEFTGLLDRIRLAEDIEPVLSTINEKCLVQEDNKNWGLTLTCRKDAADQRNQSELDALPGKIRVFEGQVSGRMGGTGDKLQLPSPLKLRLKINAQVMFTKNDPDKRWVNGSLGRVLSFKGGSIQVQMTSDESKCVHDVQKARWDSFEYEYDYDEERIKPTVVGSYVQFPLMAAWAVTIHKSQGKTLDRIRIDLGSGAFASGQVYVALSRCRSIADIRLARSIKPRDVKCDERIKRFYQALQASQA